jgi:hypothetical protein
MATTAQGDKTHNTKISLRWKLQITNQFITLGHKNCTRNFVTVCCIRFTQLSKPGSSGSIVSGYWLDDLAIKVRSPAEAEGFFL